MHVEYAQWTPSALTHPRLKRVSSDEVDGQVHQELMFELRADGPRSSTGGSRGRLRMAAVQSGRPHADGPWSSGFGWPKGAPSR